MTIIIGFCCELLILQVEHRRIELLKHPVVKSLIKYKWNKYGQVIYFFNLAFYSLFLIFLTSFAMVVLNPSHPTCKQSQLLYSRNFLTSMYTCMIWQNFYTIKSHIDTYDSERWNYIPQLLCQV